MNTDHPIYLVNVTDDLDPETGINTIALVDRPAIERTWTAFAAAPERAAFAIADASRRIVSGPILLADTPVYRVVNGVPQYWVFTKDAVERIALKYARIGAQSSVNEMHDPAQRVEGVTLFESYLSDTSRGNAPMKGYEDAPDGSWFGSMKIANDAVWAKVQDGTFTGFSIEGFVTERVLMRADDAEDEAFWKGLAEIATMIDAG